MTFSGRCLGHGCRAWAWVGEWPISLRWGWERHQEAPQQMTLKSPAACSLQPAFGERSYLWECAGAPQSLRADAPQVICSRPCRTSRVFAGGGHGCLLANDFKGIRSSGKMARIGKRRPSSGMKSRFSQRSANLVILVARGSLGGRIHESGHP